MKVLSLSVVLVAGLIWPLASEAQIATGTRGITQADCNVAKLGDAIPVSQIGEPVSGVKLSEPRWVEAARNGGAYCSVNGSLAPVEQSPNARPINFQVAFPSAWNGRSVQLGGGGMNGTIPMLAGAQLALGYVTYGSDSGHQTGGFGGGPGGFPGPGVFPGAGAAKGGPGGGKGPGAPPAARPSGPNPADNWALSDEAIKNLGFLQMKKTHDAAMVLVQRMYGASPKYNYYLGTSQGGREALTVAQRYPKDYDGIAANVPIVGFSSLMLGPAAIRIREKPAASWVTLAKINAIRGEFMRQCDKLDGLADGIINNYMACRSAFDVTPGKDRRERDPWATKRCPNNVDPNPADTSANACLTSGQIETLQFVYSRYPFAAPLANKAKTFGMWLPNTDPSGSGLIANGRFLGQETASEDARKFNWLGELGVTAFLMKDLSANPLDYVEGGKWAARREELSEWLDSTNPDLSAFEKRGGKMIVAIGTNDTLASPGTQLDYYRSVLNKMGRAKVDRFARLYVLPQTGHGLSGANYSTDGDGKQIEPKPIPNTWDRFALLVDWVENGKAPSKSITVTVGERSLPMCSYPEYPKYNSGPVNASASYSCSAK